MKRIAVLLLAVALCGGCATHYTIVLQNGETITAKGKPKYDKDKGVYYFTDAQGNKEHVLGGNVREIAPENMVDKSYYLPTPAH